MQTSPLNDLESALDSTAATVADVRDDQWDLPSPCAGWSARDVLNHLVGGHLHFAGTLGGSAEPAEPAGQVRPDAATAYRDSARTMLEAFRAPGALETMMRLPIGTVPGLVGLHLRVVEALAHGWDIAHATGQQPRGDEEVAERALQFTLRMLPGIPQEHRPFAPPVTVSEDRAALERLAASLGREIGGSRPVQGP